MYSDRERVRNDGFSGKPHKIQISFVCMSSRMFYAFADIRRKLKEFYPDTGAPGTIVNR